MNVASNMLLQNKQSCIPWQSMLNYSRLSPFTTMHFSGLLSLTSVLFYNYNTANIAFDTWGTVCALLGES